MEHYTRFLQEETPFGAYLDPIADKLLLGSCYITLAFVDSPLFKLPRWFVAIVLLKRAVISLGAGYVSFVKHAVSIRPTWLGKLAAVVQVLFMWWLFIVLSYIGCRLLLFTFFIYYNCAYTRHSLSLYVYWL